MTQNTNPTTAAAVPPGPADTNYPAAALAQLALSESARRTAEHAAALVPAPAPDGGTEADEVHRAAALLADAQVVLDRAVVAARERGASWQAIGDQLEITRQSAQERWAERMREWTADLDRPWSTRAGTLPDGALHPKQSVAELDAWCAQQVVESGDAPADEEHLVGGRLPAHTASSRAVTALRHARALRVRDRDGEPVSDAEWAAAAALSESARPD